MNRGGYAVTTGGSHPIDANTASGYAEELASYGWLIEVSLISEREPDLRFFAVGTRDAHEAEEAVLRYPGLVREDNRSARRPLSGQEIAYLGLRAGAVRPFMKKAAN